MTIKKIYQACVDGFIKYIESKETIKIQGFDILIEHKYGVKNLLLTPKYEIAQLLSLLFQNGNVEINFDVRCQLFKDLGDKNAVSINVIAKNATGIILKEDDIKFEPTVIIFSRI